MAVPCDWHLPPGADLHACGRGGAVQTVARADAPQRSGFRQAFARGAWHREHTTTSSKPRATRTASPVRKQGLGEGRGGHAKVAPLNSVYISDWKAYLKKETYSSHEIQGLRRGRGRRSGAAARHELPKWRQGSRLKRGWGTPLYS